MTYTLAATGILMLFQRGHAHLSIEMAPDASWKFNGTLLQRGHAHLSVEMGYDFAGVKPRKDKVLQRGHAHLSVEIPTVRSVTFGSANRGFNGATLT